MPFYTSAQLEGTKEVMVEILSEFGPLEEKVFRLFLERRRKAGEPRLAFCSNYYREVYTVADSILVSETILDSSKEFTVTHRPGLGYYVSFSHERYDELRFSTPLNYVKAYASLLDEFRMLKEKYLGVTMEHPRTTIMDPINAYFDMVEKLKAVKGTPELLNLPDAYLNKALGLSELPLM